MSRNTFKEDEIGLKWDRCLVDGLVKVAGTTIFGCAIAVAIPFPIPVVTLSAGIGLGMAYTGCQRQINSSVRDRIYAKLEQEKKS